ncbi:MAG: threonine--tRNA ligase [Bacilli bacterium]|nr:threonine--tRNA ligase [Bacilli bacterium]
MINIKEDEKLNMLNHSCAHLMAQAVKHLYPNAKFWVGPAIEEGFYYDIDLGDVTLTDEDLPKIEREMKKCAKADKRIYREELSKKEALERFKDDPYKMDLISRMDENEEVISCYTQGDFTDLCRGPHVETTKKMKYFKLLKHSGAYWKGDSNNKMLQRIYGICFETEEDLNNYLKELEEAKQRDHRKIGKELGIYMMSDLVGKGLPMYLPNGFILWNELENYIRNKEIKRGYKHVQTPPIGNVELYKISGHLDHYKDAMFPIMEVEDEEYVIRPMNCPHHMVMYSNDIHSYRDLPLRIAEIARDCRYETSGSLKGIERVRTFCQNDSHIFCTPEQIESEFKDVVDLILECYKDLGIKDFKFDLALRDPEDKVKFYPDDEMWDNAENALRKILDDIGIPYREMIGDAAFYGPKLDVQVKPAVGNEFSLSTCQIDFCLPMKFGLTYVDTDGTKKTPVVLHRAVFGSLDRTIAYYLEETKGNLPTWLSPVQVNIIPVNNNYHLEYSKEIYNLLLDNNVRVELDDREEKLSYKMRESQVKKIPITIILGDKEKDDDLVSYRRHGSNKTYTMEKDTFVKLLLNEIKEKKIKSEE